MHTRSVLPVNTDWQGFARSDENLCFSKCVCTTENALELKKKNHLTPSKSIKPLRRKGLLRVKKKTEEG